MIEGGVSENSRTRTIKKKFEDEHEDEDDQKEIRGG
jgi:hypothetical protein